MSKRRGKTGPTKSVGYGYVGRWVDGDLGWWVPSFLQKYGAEGPPVADGRGPREGEPFVLCRITIEQVFDKRGRAIVRKTKKASR